MFDESSKFWIDYRNQYELNSPNTIGQRDLLIKNIHKSIKFFHSYELTNSKFNLRKNHGAIYSLCFNQDGNLLVGGTDKNALLLFDSLNHKLINQLDDAHFGSVNYIKFLNENIFSTCSEDQTIALWDLRNLKHKLRSLNGGHLSYIKNIEYEPNLNYLISSCFYGDVNIWDLNSYSSSHFGSNHSNDDLEYGFTRISSQDCSFKRILSLSCLMRMRLTNDFSKMIVCTSEGYMMVVHDLDLSTLKEDLNNFQSDLYRLMQKGHSTGFDFGSWFNPLFKNKKNRVELISDFPKNNEAHSINSLDVHPQNWCVLSRNVSRDENSEWTCVHNIQDYEKPNELTHIEMPKNNVYYPHSKFKVDSIDNSENSNIHLQAINTIRNDIDQTNLRVPFSDNQLNQNEQINNDIHVSPIIIISTRSISRRATLLNPNISYRKIKPGSNPPKIFCNLPRLTHFIEEINVCKLFSKELYFSPCGRFICSPYEFGFRLLSFDKDCLELSDSMSDQTSKTPKSLIEIKRFINHTNFVTTVNFSPTHHVIASGCLNGQINFYQPVL